MNFTNLYGEFDVEPLLKENNVCDVSILMVTYESFDMTKNAIASFKKFLGRDVPIYLVDNFSSSDTVEKLKSLDVNLILNKGKTRSIANGFNGSILNSVGLDIGSKFINSDLLFVCHNDVLACKMGWLDHLIQKLDDDVKGASFVFDKMRINAMHISGCLIDWKWYKEAGVNWYPRWKDRVNMVWDVGDHYTDTLRKNDLRYFVCRNSYNDPNLSSIARCNDVVKKHNVVADISIDDEDDVIYCHLGRGILKSAGLYNTPGKMSYDQWISFGDEIVDSVT